MDIIKQFSEGHKISTRLARRSPEIISSRGVIILLTTNVDVDAELQRLNIVGFRERFHIIKATPENSKNCGNKYFIKFIQISYLLIFLFPR
jgi:hypothetical protein